MRLPWHQRRPLPLLLAYLAGLLSGPPLAYLAVLRAVRRRVLGP